MYCTRSLLGLLAYFEEQLVIQTIIADPQTNESVNVPTKQMYQTPIRRSPLPTG